jgi:hypothetical protein
MSKLHQDRSPWRKYSRNQLALIHFGCTTGDLPLSLLSHLMILNDVSC